MSVGLCAVAIGIAAFFFRFNSLSGSLGGFTNDQFVPLARVEMLMRGEQPLRDFADAELRGAWPALSYEASAWAQRLGGRTLLPEAYLTAGALALAHALVFVLTLSITKRWWLALLVTVLCVVSAPRHYSYPKILMLTAGVAAIWAVTTNPSARRLLLAAAITSVAALFRHDCGGYVALGIIAGLVARDAGAWPIVARRVAMFIGFTALLLLPSAVWVQMYEGIPSYVRSNLIVAGLEAGRTELVDVPYPSPGLLFDSEGLQLLSYYALWSCLAVAFVVIAWRVSRPYGSRMTAEERGLGVGLFVMALLSAHFLLRDPLVARLSDAVVPIGILGAWSVSTAGTIDTPAVRRLSMCVASLLLCFVAAASWIFMGVQRTLSDSGMTTSVDRVLEEFGHVRSSLAQLPPEDWSTVDAAGSLAAARYVSECTSADDYLFIAGDMPEIAVFARRRFAAGQAVFAKTWYSSVSDQQRAVARLASQSVPVVLAEAGSVDREFAAIYPLVARYVRAHYTEVGTIADESKPLLVFVDSRKKPRRTDPHLGLPCFQ